MPFGSSQLYDQYYDPYEGSYASPPQLPEPLPVPVSSTPSRVSSSGSSNAGWGGTGWNRPGWTAPGTVTKRSNLPILGQQGFFIPSGQQTTETKNILPTMPTPPPIPDYPALNIPEWDTGKVKTKTQAAAAPGLRRLRGEVRKAQMASYDNPNVKRMTLRDALAGYGEGIENVLAGARRQAISEYEAEYAPQVSKAQAEWQANISRINNNFQAAWRDYMNRVAQQTIRY